MSVKSKIYNRLFGLKLLYRNLKAKPERMKEAREGIRKLEEAGEADKRIFFCGIPLHRNLGDQCQRRLIEKWCRDNYPEHRILSLPTWAFYEKSFRRKLETAAGPKDIFVIQSGYCTTSRHFDHPMHRYIVSSFRENPVLIMPQTVRFLEDRDGIRTGKIYDRHRHLLFLARDKVSYASALKYFPGTKVLLYPDIVTSLIGSFDASAHREGVLLCVRNDGEKKYGQEEIEKIKRTFEKKGVRCEMTDTNSDLSPDLSTEEFKAELEKVLRYFASFRAVITDRYHGTIFSMIANTPVIVLATRDHKVRTGTEWFKGVYDNAFSNADSIEEAIAKAEGLLESPAPVRNRSYFGPAYYEKLKSEFERITQFNG